MQQLYGYDVLNCYTIDPADVNDRSGRTDKRQVILRDRLKAAAVSLNPDIPAAAIDDAIEQVCDRRQDMATLVADREVGAVLDQYLPEDSYDKDLFIQKRDKVFELTLDLAINHQRWAA